MGAKNLSKMQNLANNLRSASGNSNVKFPRDIDFQMISNTLFIEISSKAIFENMQNDSSAFEAWAIILKAYISNISRVVFKWEDPLLHFTLPNNRQHYQRFLFRMRRFTDSYDWADIDKSNLVSFLQYVIPSDGTNILNIPSKKRPRNYKVLKSLSQYSESELEEFIMSHDLTNREFLKFSNLKIVDNQLPVGVFKERKSNTTKIFTGSKSAIDIWGINKQNEVCIYELKNSKNKKVGCLTEMLFYSFLINDVIKGDLVFESLDYPGLKDIKNAKRVNCFLLAPNTHSLINTAVFDVLNKTNSGITYGNMKIMSSSNGLVFKMI